MPAMNRFGILGFRAALIAYWPALFTATHYPKLELGGSIHVSDKVLHAVAFGLLAFFYWMFRRTLRRPISATFLPRALIVLILYAALDEFLQQFVNRTTDFYDWLADVAGISAVLLALELHRRLAQRGDARSATTDD